MKKLLVLFSLVLVFCSCEFVPQNAATTTAEITAQTTAEITTFPASDAFVPDKDTALVARYEGDGYVACKFSDEAGEKIYFAVHLANGQSIRVDRDENVSLIPTLSQMVHFVDVNFDGTNDLCISMGGFGAQGALAYKAYLNVGGKYELCVGFDEIPNPVIDSKNQIILGTNRESAAKHAYSKYKIENGKATELETVIYNVADDTVEKGCLITPASEFAEWDFTNKKWSNIIGIKPKKEYLVKDTPYYVCEKTRGVNAWKYEFTADGGMLVTTHNGHETYYNDLGQVYKRIWYNDGEFLAKSFYTYDENGNLAKYEYYDKNGTQTEKITYIDGKPLSHEYSDGSWQKWEYNENGQLVKCSLHETDEEVMHTDEITEYFYDEAGKKIKTVSKYNGNDEEYVTEYFYDENGYEICDSNNNFVRTYYPDGTLKSERINYREVYGPEYYEYTPDGQLAFYAQVGEDEHYADVQAYTYYGDGRIKSAYYYRYSPEDEKYYNIRRIEVSYTEDGRRIDRQYVNNKDMELELACEVALSYDHLGNLVFIDYITDGDIVLDFSYNHPDFGYIYDVATCEYDEYGRLTKIETKATMTETYKYADCTERQYELYQKVISQQ